MPARTSAGISSRPIASMPPADLRRVLAGLMAAIVAAFTVLTVWPGIDLAVSAAFYRPGNGFPVDSIAVVEAFRYLIWGASIAMLVLALAALPVAALRRRPVLRLGPRDWGFILLLYALGPGLLVEGILKRVWGRARPADVEQFGGARQFTPVADIADQCTRNCSFVAGEMAGATALALALVLILWRWRDRIGERAFRLGLGLAGAQAVLIGVQRIASGRHFLSDVLLSALFVTVVAVLLARLIGEDRPGGGC